jgi:glycosyltransferase 2 family protein
LKLDWRGALGIAISIALLWWALHGIPVREVSATLRSANLPLFLLSAALATAVFPLRALRWRPILDPVAPNLPFGMLWPAVAIGFMVTNVVPARAGELARAFALTHETSRPRAGVPRVPFAAALASLVVDRLFDAFVVLALALLAIFSPSFPGNTRIGGMPATRWASLGILGMLALAAVVYAIVFFPTWLITAYEAISRRVAPALEARGREVLHHFATGLSVLRNPARFMTILLWATALWLTNALAFWVAFQAVGIQVPWPAALFLQGLIALGVAVPSAPGFFGVFEVCATIGLSVYGIPRELAVAWAIGFHVLSFIPITLIGAWYFARMGLHLSQVQQQAEQV